MDKAKRRRAARSAHAAAPGLQLSDGELELVRKGVRALSPDALTEAEIAMAMKLLGKLATEKTRRSMSPAPAKATSSLEVAVLSSTTITPKQQRAIEAGKAGECTQCGRIVGCYAPAGGDGTMREALGHNTPSGGDCHGSWTPVKGWE